MDLSPVIVVWEDAVKDIDFDGDPETAGATIILMDIGFLVQKNKKMVVLAGEKTEDGTSVRWTMSIPAKMVRQIIPLGTINA